ncbi:histone-like nucleoid-structuring protein Lsr2 [Kitasatospora sp. NPDC004669]|uniref:Lsr2 family DNA-binding protein n=1 Tax=Kitasatospora sp. NPDC004669 TaxID=3154555 RepID=UPI0033B8CE6B
MSRRPLLIFEELPLLCRQSGSGTEPLQQLVHSRVLSGAPARPRALDGPRPEDEAVRRWARAHGMVVNDRGRVPSGIREAYEVSRR